MASTEVDEQSFLNGLLSSARVHARGDDGYGTGRSGEGSGGGSVIPLFRIIICLRQAGEIEPIQAGINVFFGFVF